VSARLSEHNKGEVAISMAGHAPRSPRYKLMQTLEDNKRRAEARKRKPKSRMVSTIADLFAQR
jgi:hypothetical protein